VYFGVVQRLSKGPKAKMKNATFRKTWMKLTVWIWEQERQGTGLIFAEGRGILYMYYYVDLGFPK